MRYWKKEQENDEVTMKYVPGNQVEKVLNRISILHNKRKDYNETWYKKEMDNLLKQLKNELEGDV